MKFLLAAVILLSAQIALAGNLLSIREPITLDYGASPRLAVVFNHNTHKSVKCRTCHHIADEQGQRFVKCTREECHSLKGSRQRNPMSAFMAYHARGVDMSCYGCHLQERAKYPSFKGCQPCHMGPMTRARIAEANAQANASGDASGVK